MGLELNPDLGLGFPFAAEAYVGLGTAGGLLDDVDLDDGIAAGFELGDEEAKAPSSGCAPPAAIPAPVQPRTEPPKKTDDTLKKVLIVGDSISGNLHIKSIETATKAAVKAIKAYSSIHDDVENAAKNAAKFPAKNFTDVIPTELAKEVPDALIIQSGSVDITNLKTNSTDAVQYMEYFKQQAVVSANNIFQAATDAAKRHPKLKKIILMKQVPRYDDNSSSPPGVKGALSKLFNDTLDKLMSERPVDKLLIGNHNIDCSGGVLKARYENLRLNKYDGIHMFGPSGMKCYTNSVLNILSSAQLVKVTPPKYYDDHKSCNQAKYQARQTNRQTHPKSLFKQKTVQSADSNKSNDMDYQYNVPTHSRFAKLSDFFPEN